MPDLLMSRSELETVRGLALAIGPLPSDAPAPKGTPVYNRYTTQRDHHRESRTAASLRSPSLTML